MIKTWAELINVLCSVQSWPYFDVTWNWCAFILFLFYSKIVHKMFSTKYPSFEVRFIHFRIEDNKFCSWLGFQVFYAAAMLVTNLWPCTVCMYMCVVSGSTSAARSLLSTLWLFLCCYCVHLVTQRRLSCGHFRPSFTSVLWTHSAGWLCWTLTYFVRCLRDVLMGHSVLLSCDVSLASFNTGSFCVILVFCVVVELTTFAVGCMNVDGHRYEDCLAFTTQQY